MYNTSVILLINRYWLLFRTRSLQLLQFLPLINQYIYNKYFMAILNFLDQVTFNPQGTVLLSASADKTARTWNTTTGKVIQVLEGHTDEIFSCAFNYDGNKIITGSKDNTCRVWQWYWPPNCFRVMNWGWKWINIELCLVCGIYSSRTLCTQMTFVYIYFILYIEHWIPLWSTDGLKVWRFIYVSLCNYWVFYERESSFVFCTSHFGKQML